MTDREEFEKWLGNEWYDVQERVLLYTAWRAARRWIPVSERLPEIGKTGAYASDVVLTTDGNDVHMCKYVETKSLCWWQEIYTGERYTLRYMKYWQPLPPPPEDV